jgi:hemolysin activation/secretion protein
VIVRRGMVVAIVLAGGGLLSPALSLAGPAPTPGAVQDTLRPPPAPLPTPGTAAVLRPEDSPTRPKQALDRTVVVQSLAISGNTLISSAELEAEVAFVIGQALNIEQIYAIADTLTALYRARGYSASSVFLPEQRVDSGVIRLEVVEARVGQTFIEGAGIYDEDVLRATLRGLEDGAFLRDDLLERQVLILNERPGLDARLFLEPGLEFGTSNIVLKLTEDPGDLSVSLDNHGSEVIGERRLTVAGALNSPSGVGDRLSGSYLYAEDGLLTALSLAYMRPVGQRDATFTVSASRSDYEIAGAAFAALGISGDSTNLRLEYGRPLHVSRYRNSGFRLALNRIETTSEVTSVAIREATDITHAEWLYIASRVDPQTTESWSFSAGLASNFQRQDVPGADPDGIDPSAMLAKLELDGAWGYPLSRRWFINTRGSLQWTPEPLPDTQKFSVGGPYSLRGYGASEARGDSGASLTLELQRVGRVGLTAFSGSLFVEGAVLRTEDRVAANTPVPGTSTSLQSAGLGFHMNANGRFSLGLTWATPIGSYVPLQGDDPRLWATVAVQF